MEEEDNDDLPMQLLEIDAELAEIVIDHLLADGILQEIPIIGIAIKVAKAGKTITDRLFLEKVRRFLVSLSAIKEDDRQAFYDRMQQDKKQRKKVGEAVALILDRLDDLDKAEILAKVFGAFIENRLSLDEFRRLASAIDMAFIEDLRLLVHSSQRESGDRDVYFPALVRTGLTEVSRTGVAFGGGFTTHSIHITKLGELFIDVMNGAPQS